MVGKLKLFFEGRVEFKTEDGGQARIAEIVHRDGGDHRIFMRLHSFDEKGMHPEVAILSGTRVRITVEQL